MGTQVYKRQLRSSSAAGDFGLADKALTSTDFIRIGAYTVLAGEKIEVGGGYAYIFLKNATVQFHGTIKLFAQKSTAKDKTAIIELHTSVCGSETDMTQKPFLKPERKIVIKQDSLLIIEAKSDAASEALKQTGTIISIPVIVYDIA